MRHLTKVGRDYEISDPFNMAGTCSNWRLFSRSHICHPLQDSRHIQEVGVVREGVRENQGRIYGNRQFFYGLQIQTGKLPETESGRNREDAKGSKFTDG